MRTGSVERHQGKRGAVWRIRYRDATGRRVRETLGPEAVGWTKTRAEDALRERLVAVKRDRHTKLRPVTFEVFAREWLATYPDLRGLKRSTRSGYTTLIERHLIPAFGPLALDAIEAGQIERYVTQRLRAGYSASSLNRHLGCCRSCSWRRCGGAWCG
jgi:Phage integrase, N-terminal SAM-like domain